MVYTPDSTLLPSPVGSHHERRNSQGAKRCEETAASLRPSIDQVTHAWRSMLLYSLCDGGSFAPGQYYVHRPHPAASSRGEARSRNVSCGRALYSSANSDSTPRRPVSRCLPRMGWSARLLARNPPMFMRSSLPLRWAALLAAPVASTAAERGPSTPEERKQALGIIQRFQTDPVNPTLHAERQRLTKWIIKSPTSR